MVGGPKFRNDERVRRTNTDPYGTGEMGQALPLVALSKYEKAFTARSLDPTKDPKKEISGRTMRLVAERQASILPFTPENDRIGVRGHMAKAFSAGRGHFMDVRRKLNEGEITFREAQKGAALNVAEQRSDRANAGVRQAIHRYREERVSTEVDSRMANIQLGRDSFLALNDSRLSEDARDAKQREFHGALVAGCGKRAGDVWVEAYDRGPSAPLVQQLSECRENMVRSQSSLRDAEKQNDQKAVAEARARAEASRVAMGAAAERLKREVREACGDKADEFMSKSVNSPVLGALEGVREARRSGRDVAGAETRMERVLATELGNPEQASTVMADLRRASTDEALDAVIRPVESLRCQRVGSEIDFERIQRVAEPVLREQASRHLLVESARAGELRARAGVDVLLERSTQFEDDRRAQSFQRFLRESKVEDKLSVMYAGFVKDPGEMRKYFGPEGREMMAQAGDGRVPASCLNDDGTLRWEEVRNWVGLPAHGSAVSPEEREAEDNWREVVETLNRTQKDGCMVGAHGEELNPGIALIHSIRSGGTPHEQAQKAAHRAVVNASMDYATAQRALVFQSENRAEGRGEELQLDNLASDFLQNEEWLARVEAAKSHLTAEGAFEILNKFNAAESEYAESLQQQWLDVQGAAANARFQACVLEGGEPMTPMEERRIEMAAAFAMGHPLLRDWVSKQGGVWADPGHSSEMTAEDREFLQKMGTRIGLGARLGEDWAIKLNEGEVTPEAMRVLAEGHISGEQAGAIARAMSTKSDATDLDPETKKSLLAEAEGFAQDGLANDRAHAEIQNLDLTKTTDRVKLWRALDFDFSERMKAGREDLAAWTDKACVTLKAAWANQTMGNIRSGTRIGFHTVLGGSKAVYQLGASAVGTAQALVQAIMALQRAQEAGGSQNQADILGAATQVWEGGLGLGRAGAAPISGVVQAGSVAIATGKKLTDIPHETREKMARLMRFEEMGKGLRDQEAQTASQDAKEAAEATYNYTTEFRRAADKAREFAIATEPRERERWRTELEASRMLMEGHMATIGAHYPEIAEVLKTNGAYSLDGLNATLDRIERMVPERYRNVFGNPLGIGARVPVMTDREGRTVPGLVHGDGAPLIDLGRNQSGSTLGAVVDERKIRFTRINMADPKSGAGAVAEEIGEIQVGRWAALEHSWQSMAASGRSPAREYPPEYSADFKVKKDSSPTKSEEKQAEQEWEERRREWDVFVRLKTTGGLEPWQSNAVEILDRFSNRMGGNLKQFTCTLPDHRAFQEDLTDAVRSGDSGALGFMNTPDSEMRREMAQVDKTLKLMERRTPMELIAFYNAMMLDRHGDRVAEWEDAIDANNQEFGW